MNSIEEERIDEIDRYYKPIEKFDSWNSKVFWISASLSIVVLYTELIPWAHFKDISSLLFTLSVVLNLALTLYLRFNLIPIAEKKRRQQLLSNSFDIPLTPEETKKYYNNLLAPSVKRLGANILENSFYAKDVCGRMAFRERIKVLI